jgi:hypothetical protein
MSSELDYASIGENKEADAELKIAKALEEAKAEASRIAIEAVNEALKAQDLKNAPVFGNEERDTGQVNYRPALQMERENIVKKAELPTPKRDIPSFLSEEEKTFFTTNTNGGGSLDLPFEIYIGSEVPIGGTEPQVFIGAKDGTLELEPITGVKEFAPTADTWWLQAKIEINTATGETVSRTVEFVTVLGVPTPAIAYLTLGKIVVGGDGIPQEASIQQFNYGPILAVKCGGVTTKWNVILY